MRLLRKIIGTWFLFMSSTLSFGGIAFSGELGASFDSTGPGFAYNGFVYYKIDEQSLVGLGAGSQQGGTPFLGRLYVRFPFGRIILPVAIGDMGYLSHPEKSQAGFIWRGGGGLDWKNGKRSSILLLGGYQASPAGRGYFARAGLLLEF